MNTPSDSLSDYPFGQQAAAPATLSRTRPLYWSVRRELWENRSIWIVPLTAAALVLFAFAIGTIHLPRGVHIKIDAKPRAGHSALPYSIAAVAVIVTAFITGAFYCLGALHNERRDRSILFWKSLPVSDLTTVLSKAAIPLVVLPLVSFAVIVVLQLLMLLAGTTARLVEGLSVTALWTQVPLPEMSIVLLYSLATLTLWHAPLYAWLLLISGWARRTFLWAVLPPLAVCLVEKIAFDTANAADLLGDRLLGSFSRAFVVKSGDDDTIIPLSQLDPIGFLSSPGLWIGLAVAAALLAAAVWQRHRREPL